MDPQPERDEPFSPSPALLEQLAFRSQLRYFFRRALTALDASVSDHGLSPMGYHAVLVLGGAGPQGMWEHELVDNLSSSSAHTSVLTRQLVAQGLVARDREGPDRRRVTLRLTSQGWRALAAIADEHQQRLHELVEGWDPRAFEGLLERIMSVYLGLEGRVSVETLRPTEIA